MSIDGLIADLRRSALRAELACAAIPFMGMRQGAAVVVLDYETGQQKQLAIAISRAGGTPPTLPTYALVVEGQRP